jgi:hypothetical protein
MLSISWPPDSLLRMIAAEFALVLHDGLEGVINTEVGHVPSLSQQGLSPNF